MPCEFVYHEAPCRDNRIISLPLRHAQKRGRIATRPTAITPVLSPCNPRRMPTRGKKSCLRLLRYVRRTRMRCAHVRSATLGRTRLLHSVLTSPVSRTRLRGRGNRRWFLRAIWIVSREERHPWMIDYNNINDEQLPFPVILDKISFNITLIFYNTY